MGHASVKVRHTRPNERALLAHGMYAGATGFDRSVPDGEKRTTFTELVWPERLQTYTGVAKPWASGAICNYCLSRMNAGLVVSATKC